MGLKERVDQLGEDIAGVKYMQIDFILQLSTLL